MTRVGTPFLALVFVLGGACSGRSSMEHAKDAAGADRAATEDVSGSGGAGATVPDGAAPGGMSGGAGRDGGGGGIAGTGGRGTGGAAVDAGAADAFGNGVRLCSGTAPVTGTGSCRTVADCGPVGPVVCSVGRHDWGPAACPLGPGSQPCPNECASDANCTARAGGRCAPYTRSCPLCNGHTCTYPPPPCTSSPSSCAADERCRSDGTCEYVPCNEGGVCATSFRCNPTSTKADKRGCEPVACDSGYACPSGMRCNLGSARADIFGCELTPCDAGYTCPAETRCNVGSSRADQRGCEYTPCSDGFACSENTRCTVTAPAANDHGCRAMTCKSDLDCDCGYCVNGACSAAPGTCQYPPQ